MEKRKMEKLGIETSLLGFGCMRFPVTAEGRIDEPLAERMMDRAIASGVNYIDTAYPYHGGESETFVGKVLKKYPRDSFYLATKLPCWKVEKLEDIDSIFREQLGKLQTDYIDFYLVHALNKDRFKKITEMGGIKRLEELKAEGKIKYLGFSFHDDYDTFEKILCYRDWDFCQIQLNYMDVNEQAGLRGYGLTEEKNVPLVVMEPVKGGTLAQVPEEAEKLFKDYDADMSVPSWAIRFAASLEHVMVVLSGMSNIGQMEDNIGYMEKFRPLTEEEMSLCYKVADIINGQIAIPCTGCSYCTGGCPKKIAIPQYFSLYNEDMREHLEEKGWTVNFSNYAALTEKFGRAKDCIGCGQCERVCPQHLPIIENLKEVSTHFDH